MKQLCVIDNYVNALLAQNIPLNELKVIEQEFLCFKQLLLDPANAQVFFSPILSIENKKQLIRKLQAAELLSDTSANFLQLLVDNGRIASFPKIADEFSKALLDREHISMACVVSAKALRPEEEESIRKLITDRFQQEVVIKNIIDPDLLGGVIVKMKGWEADLSIRGVLDHLKQRLTVDNLIN